MAEQQMQLPPEAQKLLMQLQNYQQQYQGIALQKEALNIQNLDIEKALEELGKVKGDGEVFKAVGPILVKVKKEDIEGELKERKETADVRLKSIEKQEEALKKKVQDAQKKLQEIFKSTGSAE